MEDIKEPAVEKYFLGPGYRELKTIIKQAKYSDDEIIEDLEVAREKWRNEGDFFRFPLCAFYNLTIWQMKIFGKIFSCLLSAFYACILFVFMIADYVWMILIKIVEIVIVKKKRISHFCTNCQRRYTMPIYKCSCDAKHYKLVPGKYGVVRRRCNCGAVLPTTEMFKVKGVKRNELKAFCPFCDSEGILTEDKQKDSVQIVIPIGGGRSCGKSVFITAFSCLFQDDIAPLKRMDVDLEDNAYDEQMKERYENMELMFRKGGSQRTEAVLDKTKSSSRDFTFWIEHDSYDVPRLVHILDIDGESFVNNSEVRTPWQFETAKVVLLFVDPLSIDSFFKEKEEMLAEEDKMGIGAVPIFQVLESLEYKLRTILKLRRNEKIKTKVAIIIGKIDSAGLENIVGLTAAERLIRTEPEKFTKKYAAMDYLCRQFLEKYGEGRFIEKLDTEFENTRFFACSAIGHPLNKGSYKPKGVAEIMEWAMGESDNATKKIWNDNVF